MTDGKSATELQKLGYRKATVWVVDRDNKEATERWRESARLAAGADERDQSNEIGAFLLDEMLRDDL
jgi:G:T-mismatch repair DNA endonuclease (very short patch repair protein)